MLTLSLSGRFLLPCKCGLLIQLLRKLTLNIYKVRTLQFCDYNEIYIYSEMTSLAGNKKSSSFFFFTVSLKKPCSLFAHLALPFRLCFQHF